MESNEQTTQQEMVMVTLELPRDLVDWIDGLKNQLGYRSRGPMVAQLLRELVPEPEEETEAPAPSTTV
jgi:metal-responsive CopG/Arc/MetJ family transcriptional regulator